MLVAACSAVALLAIVLRLPRWHSDHLAAGAWAAASRGQYVLILTTAGDTADQAALAAAARRHGASLHGLEEVD